MNEMVFNNIIISSLYGQGFGYNYIDPCNQQTNLNYKTETTENGFGFAIITNEDFYLVRSRRNITELDTTSLPRFWKIVSLCGQHKRKELKSAKQLTWKMS